MPSLFEEFRAVVEALDVAGVPFSVCGGLAMSIHAHPRATIDIDLLAPVAVIHRLTKYAPPDPDVLLLDVIEVDSGVSLEGRE